MIAIGLELFEHYSAEKLPSAERGGTQPLREHPLGRIAHFIVLHLFTQNNYRMRLDDAFEEVDHAMNLPKGLGFSSVN